MRLQRGQSNTRWVYTTVRKGQGDCLVRSLKILLAQFAVTLLR